jgi:hypothetical protein
MKKPTSWYTQGSRPERNAEAALFGGALAFLSALSVSVHRDPRIVGEDRGMTVGAVHRSPARIWALSGTAG